MAAQRSLLADESVKYNGNNGNNAITITVSLSNLMQEMVLSQSR